MQGRRCLTLLFAAAWFALPQTGANAGLFDDDEARARVEQLRKQIADLTVGAESLNRNQLDFANQLDVLRADAAKLRGQIEVIAYELETAQKRQKDFYVDLDNRVRKLEAAPVAATEAPKPELDGETRLYESAVGALKNLKYPEAANQFAAFILAYPASPLLGSAHYWGGYAHAQNKDHAKAAELFGKFAAGWPTDERVPGALESQIFSLEMLKDTKGARTALTALATRYPASEAGKRAQQRLKKK